MPGGETCVPVMCSGGNKTAETCCDASNCRYVVSDGTEFPCESSGDCNKAATDLVNYCAK